MAKKIEVPETPVTRPGFRDPDYVQAVVLQMGTGYLEALDELCKSNGRSRRDIVEILVTEAFIELQDDPDARIDPIR